MNNEIRVMQMIDSLSIGGAERVSVNYANAISEQKNCKSFHCTTREEGMLKKFLSKDVQNFFMQKKSLFDLKAYARLIKFIKENEISIIHAHSTSFFTAIIAKLFTGVKIVWHDHYGDGENIDKRPKVALKIGSLLFSYVISVNQILKLWANKTLFIDSSKIEYVPNYADLVFDNSIPDIPGDEGKRIVVLANLRPQKDHLNMLKAFNNILLNGDYNDWHLLLVGKDWHDNYSDSIKNYIKTNKMSKTVSILGGRSDASQILKSSEIGVLSSTSEGLPIALLEYGLASLAVVATDVGECSSVLNNGSAGCLIEANNSEALTEALEKLMKSKTIRDELGKAFNKYVENNYSKNNIIKLIIMKYQEL